MGPVESGALEAVEIAAFTDFFRAAPDVTRTAHHAHVFEVGAARCLGCIGLEPGVIFRRLLGLGVGEIANEAQLDVALAHMNALRQSYVVSVSPQAHPTDISGWLEVRVDCRKLRRAVRESP